LIAPPEQVPDKTAYEQRGSKEQPPFGNADQPDEQESHDDHGFNGMSRPTACAKPAEWNHFQGIPVLISASSYFAEWAVAKGSMRSHKICSPFDAAKIP
jgi:hypothetical protein